MANRSYTVSAYGSLTPGIHARYIYVNNITSNAVLRARGSGKGGSFDYEITKGSKIGPTGFDITDIEFINDSASAIDVDLSIGGVKYDESILSGTVSINAPGVIQDVVDVSILATVVTSILASNVNRDEIIVTSLATNAADVRLGSSGVGAARGFILSPGDTFVLNTTAELFAFSAAAATLAVSYTE